MTKVDIYNTLSKGSFLTIDILKEANQILRCKNDLILVYDFTDKSEEDYNPHLLFYNEELKLYSSCFLPSIKVDSISDKFELFIKPKESLKKKSKWFRNDLPKKYKFIIQKKENDYNLAGGKISNKIIDSIKYIPNNDVILYVKKSKDLYAGIHYEFNKVRPDSLKLNYTELDIIKFPLFELIFNNTYNTISTHFYENKVNRNESINYKISDIYLIDSIALNNFYNQVWIDLK